MKHSRFVNIIASISLLTLAVVVNTPVTVNAQSGILKVGPGHPYEIIQAAVDDANPGDKVFVYPFAAPGPEYWETVHITTDNIQVIAPGRDVSVVPPIGGDPSFLVEADRVVIRGFEMFGPRVSMGILFAGSHNIFADNVIHPFYDDDVNAIVAEESGGSNYNIIENNTIFDAGFAIRMVAAPGTMNEGNIIRNNTIYDSDYGIAVMNGNRFTISGNSITSGQGGGHGIQLIANNDGVQGYHRVTFNKIENIIGEGIALYADGKSTLRNNLIQANEIKNSAYNGISLYADPEAKVINNSIISNNIIVSGKSGIFLFLRASSNRIIKNSVWTNAGYGIFVEGDRNWFIGNTVLDNVDNDIYDTGSNNKWINNTYETNDKTTDIQEITEPPDLIYLNLPLVSTE